MENLKVLKTVENGKLDKEKSKKLTGYPSIDRVHEIGYEEKMKNLENSNQSLFDFIYEKNKDRLNKPALNYFDNRIKYRDFLENSTRVALSLSHYGVKKGDIITVISPSIPEAFYTLLGASKLGACVNFVDPRYGEKAIEHKINEAGSTFVIAYDGTVKTYNRKTKEYNQIHTLDKIKNIIGNTNVKTVVSLPASNSVNLMSIIKNDTIRAALKEKPVKSEFKDAIPWKVFFKNGKYGDFKDFAEFEPNKPVAIVATGGSTGMPKGVMLSNENIIGAVNQCMLTGMFPEEARWYDIMPPCIAYGLADGFMLPLALGNEIRLNPDPTAMSLKKTYQLQMVEDFVRFDPHTIACAPNHVPEIVGSEEFKNAKTSLINFIVGGDSLNVEQVKRMNGELEKIERPSSFNKRFLKGKDMLVINTGYGTSECTGASSVAPSNEEVKIGTVGKILPNQIVTTFKYNEEEEKFEELKYVSNDDIDNIDTSMVGEICIAGPNVTLGYLNNEKETNGTFINHDGHRWLHTGDVGFIDEDGYVHFVDREKYIGVGYDGFKIAPLEIETVILNDPRIDACKAIIIKDPEREKGETIKVYYTLNKGVSAAEVADVERMANDLCSKYLADYKCPEYYECVAKLPITGSGKIDVMALRADAEEKLINKSGKVKVKK